MSGESGLVWFTHLEIKSARAARRLPLDNAATTQQSLRRLPQVESNITGSSFIPAWSRSFSLVSQV